MMNLVGGSFMTPMHMAQRPTLAQGAPSAATDTVTISANGNPVVINKNDGARRFTTADKVTFTGMFLAAGGIVTAVASAACGANPLVGFGVFALGAMLAVGGACSQSGSGSSDASDLADPANPASPLSPINPANPASPLNPNGPLHL